MSVMNFPVTILLTVRNIRTKEKNGEKRKEQKILLITQSFPQSPQVFPQGFSTGGACCGYAVLVHIKRSDTLRRISHFSAGRGFYHEHFFVQKLGLDNSPRRPRRPPTGAGWPGRSFLRPERQKILKKGLILSRQGVIMRICMENEQKEVESMPNIKSSKKDVISSKIAYEKNKADKSELKTNLKKFDAAVVSGDKAAADAAYKTAVKAVDQAVNKGILHKNNAARKKSSITLKMNELA